MLEWRLIGSIQRLAIVVPLKKAPSCSRVHTKFSLRLAKAVKHHRLQAENRQLKEKLAEAGEINGIVDNCRALTGLLTQIRQVAGTDATVLIRGESGTGKELIARAIHDFSTRSTGPFIAVNLGALPETLLESELFGHEKGSFIGASRF